MGSAHRPSPRPRRRLLSAVWMFGALTLLAACGSTVPVRSDMGSVAGGARAGEAGLSAPVDAAEGGTPTAGGADAASTAGDMPGQGSVTGNSGADARGGPAPGSTSGRGTIGPRAPVKVGVYVDEGFETLAGSAGYGGDAVKLGDGRRQSEVIIADFNRRGGLAGHRIELVFAVRNSRSNDSYALQEQHACSTWTEDHHVVAAVSPLNTTDLLPRCLSKRRIPFIVNNPMNYTAESFTAAPYLAAPAMLNESRMAPVYVARLAAQGFFREGAGPTGPVVGLVRFDAPEHARVVREGIKPALARHGLRLSEEVAISQMARTSDGGAMVAQIQSAVLRFQTTGVTHVLFLDYGGTLGIFYLTAAEKNGYRPRYGLTSYSAPYALQSLSIPQEQLKNVSGVGWVPGADVDPRKAPPESAEAKRCRAIARAAGVPSGQTDSGTLLSYCETLFLLKAVADRAGTVQGLGWVRGLEAMRTAYRPVGTSASRFGPGRHDGVALVRDFRWNTGCSCFAYTSRLFPTD